MALEVEVHSSLRDFIREQGDRNWPHHLTMARLVARAFRLDRSALMQTGSSVSKYCLSYLMAILLGNRSTILVAPSSTLQYLFELEIPRLQDWLATNKQVRIGDRWQEKDDLLLTTPENWLCDRINREGKFPLNLPTLIDRADDLEEWARQQLTITLTVSDWNELIQSTPQYAELIRNTRIKLTKAIFTRPQNPYQNYRLENPESQLLSDLCDLLAQEQLLTAKFTHFWRQWQEKSTIIWASREPSQRLLRHVRHKHLERGETLRQRTSLGNARQDGPQVRLPPKQSRAYKFLRKPQETAPKEPVLMRYPKRLSSARGRIAALTVGQGLFKINLAPVEVGTTLNSIWQQQPVVIIGSFLDLESTAPIYRQQVGLDAEILSLKFSPHRQNEHIQLYIPDRLPMHNTPEFCEAFIEQTHLLVGLSSSIRRLVVVLVEDVPLQAQVGSVLAAEFGSRVRVETTSLADDGILVCSWSFWKTHQEKLPTPQLLIIATLPLPSLENPLVASRVAYHKRQRQDWFRSYLLPSALRTLQQAVVPLRESQGIVALLDNRVNFRSYGKTILSALEPCARINYIDPAWFGYMGS